MHKHENLPAIAVSFAVRSRDTAISLISAVVGIGSQSTSLVLCTGKKVKLLKKMSLRMSEIALTENNNNRCSEAIARVDDNFSETLSHDFRLFLQL